MVACGALRAWASCRKLTQVSLIMGFIWS